MQTRPLRRLTRIMFAVLILGIYPNPPHAFTQTRPAGRAGFNIFQQREVAVGEFENRGEARYAGLGDILSSSFYSYALTISTLTMSDEERLFLQELAGMDEYRESFRAAGEEIRYRLTPLIVKGKGDERNFPLSISGSYTVERTEKAEETIHLNALAHNSMTGRTDVEAKIDLPLSTLLQEPERYLLPFFREFLRYKTYTATILAEPEDALIYVDEKLVGVGRAREILLASGPHRLTVRRRGYKDFSTLFIAERDGTMTKVSLEERGVTRTIRFVSLPEGAELYIDERYAGVTPLEVRTSGEERLFTLVKEGYRDKLLNSLDIPPGGGEVHVSLIPLPAIKEISSKAELHRKRSRVLCGSGIGMLALTILLATQKTLFEQKADLYRLQGNDERSTESLQTARTYSSLTTVSIAATAGLFTFSFVEMVKYFNLYSGEQTPHAQKKRKTR